MCIMCIKVNVWINSPYIYLMHSYILPPKINSIHIYSKAIVSFLPKADIYKLDINPGTQKPINDYLSHGLHKTN